MIPPYMTQKPPEENKNKPSPVGEQRKNAILFAVIFSVLAVSVALFIAFKPERKVSEETSSVATTSVPAIAPKGSFFSSFMNFGFARQPGATATGTPRTNMFSAQRTNMFSVKPTTIFNVGTRPSSGNVNYNTGEYISAKN